MDSFAAGRKSHSLRSFGFCSRPRNGTSTHVGANAMRHRILITVILLTSQYGNCQIFNLIKKVDIIEFSGGPSSVILNSTYIDKKERELKITPTFRLSTVYGLTDKLSIVVSLLHEKKGMTIQYTTWHYDPTIDFDDCKCTTSLGQVTQNWDLHYFTFSPTLRYSVLQYLSVELGTFVSYLNKSRWSRKNHWDGTTYYSTNNPYKKYDFGLLVSLGYRIPISNNYFLTFNIQDTFGLINIADKSTSEKIKTNSLSGQIGIAYRLVDIK